MIALFDTAQLSADAATWVGLLLDLGVKGVIILLVSWGLVFTFRRASAASRHMIWSMTLSSLLMLPALSFILPAWRVPLLPPLSPAAKVKTEAAVAPDASTREGLQQARAQVAAQPRSSDSQLNPTARPKAEARPTAEQRKPSATADPQAVSQPAAATAEEAGTSAASPAAQTNWYMWALALWLAGVVVTSFRLFVGLASVRRMVSKANLITGQSWLSLASDLAWQLDLGRKVTLLKSERVAMPLTWGALRPVILLPADADEWPDERRHVVLLHELAHVKRMDCLTQTLAQMVCSLYWFNPLVWMVARRLRMERERACDDHVLDLGTKASDYASHLLEIARSFGSANCPSRWTVAKSHRSPLEGRLLAILDPNLSRRGLNRMASLLVAVVGACVVLPLAAIRPSAQTEALAREAAVDPAARALSAHAPSARATSPEGAAAESVIAPPALPEHLEQAIRQGALDPEGLQQAVADAIEQADREGGGDRSEQDSGSQAGRSRAAEALREALKDEDKEVRQQAIHALAMIGDSSVAGALIEALRDSDANVREQAAWGLGMTGGQNAVEALIQALRDADANVREQAAWALGMKGNGAAIPALIEALKDSDANVREQAAWALGMKGNATAIEALGAALRDADANVREQAAWALGMKGNGNAVELLIAALKDESPHVREQVAWALGMKGDARAAEALNAAMKDSNQSVRQQAAWALGMILMRSGGRHRDGGDRDDDDNDNAPDMKLNLNLNVQPNPNPNPNPRPRPRPDRRDN
jgi:HEAT repeat protein/beta-lactamase regulating signal transducer with metallopeptidase domain